jgi:hypothetical protein
MISSGEVDANHEPTQNTLGRPPLPIFPRPRSAARPGRRASRSALRAAWRVRSPDHVALVLGSGGKHVKRQSVGSRHVGNGEMEALGVHQRGDEGDAAAQAVELRHQHDGPVPFGQRYRGGQLRPVAARPPRFPRGLLSIPLRRRQRSCEMLDGNVRIVVSQSSTEVRIELTVLLPRITAEQLRQRGALQNC